MYNGIKLGSDADSNYLRSKLGEKISTTLKQLNDTQGKTVPNLYDMDQFSETRINLKWREYYD